MDQTYIQPKSMHKIQNTELLITPNDPYFAPKRGHSVFEEPTKCGHNKLSVEHLTLIFICCVCWRCSKELGVLLLALLMLKLDLMEHLQQEIGSEDAINHFRPLKHMHE